MIACSGTRVEYDEWIPPRKSEHNNRPAVTLREELQVICSFIRVFIIGIVDAESHRLTGDGMFISLACVALLLSRIEG